MSSAAGRSPSDGGQRARPDRDADRAADPPADATTLPERQCGRCRKRFPGDPHLHPTAIAEWWLCPPCRDALLGRRA